ncbi:MAG TPA: DUF1203 domain-containing protein [Jatrophihabitans sp.]|jgi:hypothetical protein
MTKTKTFTVHAIAPERVAGIRAARADGHGNELVPFQAGGGEPLRCCLRTADAGESIALISYAPFETPSPWREVGPVYIHTDECAGHDDDDLPVDLRTGPRLLRTYRADGTMNYAHNTLVADGEDIEATVTALLAESDVARVHVRTVLPQCFLYEITE